MSTTSLKLPDELKQRAIVAAEQRGVSPHAFMVDAIEQAAKAAEARQSFVNRALAAREDMMKTGEGYDGDEVHTYIRSRLAGRNPERPTLKKWRT
jgi:predicted transcriptional regulator